MLLLARNPQLMASLTSRARVPETYSDIQRILGFYLLTKRLVSSGIRRLHTRILASFSAQIPESGGQWYVLADRASHPDRIEGTRLLESASNNPLKIPVLQDGPYLQQLFRRYAPAWRVFEESQADRIGALYLEENRTGVDENRPVVYTHLSYTRFEGKTLAQLNYVIWFSSRPATGPLDILAGRLDGINWRVTLDTNGDVLMYDAMHNCGCYHMFFPITGLLIPKPQNASVAEPILVPDSLPNNPDGRILISISARDHYIFRVQVSGSGTPGAKAYELEAYDNLRSLPAGGNRYQSIFSEDGIIPGTDRMEKWLLWPMGVPGPGAMKQWGHHAIAFVGRRHFDDPDLIERYFMRVR